VTLHHGRFHGKDRRHLDAAIEARFGKGASRGPAVVVATQTIEQSLDLDFDALITDICPIDVLLQRIGRLWRHDHPRPEDLEMAPCTVLVPHEGLDPFFRRRSPSHNLGPGRAYEDLRAVEAARRLIATAERDGWRLPRNNGRLVELGTHEEALSAIAREVGEAWCLHGRAVEGAAIAEGQKARDWLLPLDRGFVDGTFALAELDERIRTRLGDDRILVPLPPTLRSPFGERLEDILLPAWIARTMGLDPRNELIGDCAKSHILIGGRQLAYDRFGLRPMQESGGKAR